MGRKVAIVRAAGILLLLAVLGLAGFSWYAGGLLIQPALHPVDAPPAQLGASEVTFPSESGSRIHAWFSPGIPRTGAVLLLHGVGADRSSMLGRALFLHALGYSVLVIDFQAHGESPGKHITVGDLESWDAIAAVSYLKQAAPGERVGVIGVSMGAAAVALARKPLQMSAVVLESMYPTIEEAVANRLRMQLGAWGPLCTPLLTLQLQPRLGISASQLRPIDGVARLNAPLLLIHGEVDRHTTIEEARRVFAAAVQPKTFWSVPGAAHVDIHRFAPAEYERRVGGFLAQFLAQR